MAENAQPSGDWEWMLEEGGLRLSCVLIFARDVTQDQMFEAFDLDPSSARMEEWTFDPDRPRVRVGQVGVWTFAIDEHLESFHLARHGKHVGKRLSAGTEVVVVSSSASQATEDFDYWADGTWVTAFEPYRAFDRFGAEPDRFLREMRQVGMVTEADDTAEGSEDDLRAALDLATLALVQPRSNEGFAAGSFVTQRIRHGGRRRCRRRHGQQRPEAGADGPSAGRARETPASRRSTGVAAPGCPSPPDPG